MSAKRIKLREAERRHRWNTKITWLEYWAMVVPYALRAGFSSRSTTRLKQRHFARVNDSTQIPAPLPPRPKRREKRGQSKPRRRS